MIYLSQKIKIELINEVLVGYPYEVCGFLLGYEKREVRIIDEILVVKNANIGDQRRRFEISPLDYLHSEAEAERKGLQLLGIYHSHPDHPSIPSETDRLAAQPYFSYVIISTKSDVFNTIQSWRMNENAQFEEEKIITIHNKLNNLKQHGNYHHSDTFAQVY